MGSKLPKLRAQVGVAGRRYQAEQREKARRREATAALTGVVIDGGAWLGAPMAGEPVDDVPCGATVSGTVYESESIDLKIGGKSIPQVDPPRPPRAAATGVARRLPLLTHVLLMSTLLGGIAVSVKEEP